MALAFQDAAVSAGRTASPWRWKSTQSNWT